MPEAWDYGIEDVSEDEGSGKSSRKVLVVQPTAIRLRFRMIGS